MATTITLTEEQPWIPNDPMPAWVCAIGGYEVLYEGDVNDATRWLLRFGEKSHPPIRGAGLSRDLQRFRAATHFGFLWWGSPNWWNTTWPEAWERMMILEQAALGDAPLRIFASAPTPHAPRRPRRGLHYNGGRR